MSYRFIHIQRKSLYITLLTLSFIFWFIFSAPTYRSHSILRVELLGSPGGTFSNYLSAGYEASSMANHLLASWLQSEEAYLLLKGRLNMRSIYKKGDYVSKFGSVYDVFMSGDRAEWLYFRRHLSVKVDDHGSLLNISFTSFNPKDAQQILATLLLLGKHYLKGFHQEADQSKAAYIHSLSEQLIGSLKALDASMMPYIAKDISIYPKEDYLNRLTLQTLLERKLLDLSSALIPFKHVDTRSPLKKSLLLQQDNLQTALSQRMEDTVSKLKEYQKVEALLEQRGFVFGLYKDVQEKNYKLKRQAYMDEYKINIISPPSFFAERSGPHRLKGFFISFLLISLVYWLVKE